MLHKKAYVDLCNATFMSLLPTLETRDFVLLQINRAINLLWKTLCLTTETLSHGVFNRFSPCLRVSVVQNGLSGLLGLIVNLQYLVLQYQAEG
jgi:hypothetical protein